MSESSTRAIRVGLLVVVAIAVLATGIFLIGEEQHLFSRKTDYYTRFANVSGLNAGNPVQLNGVDVGSVQRIVLPEDPAESLIRVDLSIDTRFAERIRSDSVARIKTLGLLGDKFIEVTAGSADAPLVEAGSEIPGESSSSVDALMASGEDVMANITEISSLLRDILGKMDRGEGLLGRLITDSDESERISAVIIRTLESVQQTTDRIESGDGPLPRLIGDAELADRVTGSVERLESLLVKADEGDGLLPALLDDGATRERLERTLTSLESAAGDLSAFTAELRDGDGLVPRLLFDEEYGRELSENLLEITERLNSISGNLAEGDGTVAQLIEDPEIYQALNDIVVGINESKLLRWLIRNRQKAGIKKRYREAQEEVQEQAVEPEPAADPSS